MHFLIWFILKNSTQCRSCMCGNGTNRHGTLASLTPPPPPPPPGNPNYKQSALACAWDRWGRDILNANEAKLTPNVIQTIVVPCIVSSNRTGSSADLKKTQKGDGNSRHTQIGQSTLLSKFSQPKHWNDKWTGTSTSHTKAKGKRSSLQTPIWANHQPWGITHVWMTRQEEGASSASMVRLDDNSPFLYAYNGFILARRKQSWNIRAFAFSNDFTFFSCFLAVSIMRGSLVYSLLKFINLHVCQRNFFF